MNPFLSVVMPTYNGEKYIAAALDSVREQHEDGIELIVVDDGSSDGSVDIVRRYAKELPIRLTTPGRMGNWVAASNIGIREARADWVCFLQQDDLWLPGRIARLRTEMEKAEGAIILHDAVFVGPNGQDLGPWTCPLPEGNVQPDRFIERLLVQNFIAVVSPVFRRSAVIDSGGMDEALWVCADWDLWLRLGAMGPVRFIRDRLTALRLHPASQAAARKLSPGEWEQQLATVLARHLRNGAVPDRHSASVERAARASVAVNSALSAASRGQSVQTAAVLAKLFALGPTGWHRYLRDSRIVQRVGSRLKLQWRTKG